MESTLVWLVIGVAAVWSLRSFYRTLTSRAPGSGCAGCNSSCRPDAPCPDHGHAAGFDQEGCVPPAHEPTDVR